eukprot:NODE_866_length_1146_cov_94.092247_g824_i0.p1 GENE.NODE_866_length_1146_cov_94.092247_g824_i0~~NODE_866_length_1146_cov_94.092247_g824_i0.p1  ORF type:complete len:312 (+),score=86.62 NODE_866_length_1146_cov_94.092247_g824_i0:86-1021(+)
MADETKIASLLASKADPNQVSVSFEYFPPKTAKGVETLHGKLSKEFKGANPVFVDFTWGAGGSTSELTLDLSTKSQKEFGLITNMHLTCTNMPREKVDIALEGAKAAGIRNIVALRGDPPRGESEWKAIDTGFSCALDLVKYIREKHGDYFNLSVAGYPEGHPDAIGDTEKISEENYKKEMDYLKEKVDAGGNMIITQLFYDVDLFLKFAEDCKKHGINVPVLPGIMPIQAYGGFKRMCGFCKTYVPKEIADKVEELKDNEEGLKAYGIDLAVSHCQKILDAGIKHLHFYTLNNEAATFAIMQKLGIPTGQ